MNLSTKILVGLVLGVITGLALGPSGLPFATTWIAPLGDIFLSLIKMIIVPLVLASLIVGAASVGDIKKVGRIGGKTLGLYLGTTAIAIALGLVLATLLQPGQGLSLASKAAAKAAASPPISSIIVGLIPANPMDALLKGNMLQIIVFALFIGISINAVGTKAKVVHDFFEGLAEIMYQIVGFIMKLAPIGVFALIVPVVAKNGPQVLLPLIKVVFAVYVGCFLHMLLTYLPMVKAAGVSPMKFIKAFFPAQLIAFSTCSSGGTLPVSLKCLQEGLGVSRQVSSFVMPLGATINMDGTALYQGVCALFIAQVYGIDLTMSQYMMIILTGTLASIGTAGVPGAGLIMLTLVLQTVGLPLEGIALIAGIDRVLDMPRTMVNVTGDAAVCVAVGKSEEKYEAVESLVAEEA